MTENPYTAPKGVDDPDVCVDVGNTSNPASYLLYISSIGWLCLSGLCTLASLSRGFWLGFILCFVLLAFGISAIWLARRQYDRFARRATIAWSTLTMAMSPTVTAEGLGVGLLIAYPTLIASVLVIMTVIGTQTPPSSERTPKSAETTGANR